MPARDARAATRLPDRHGMAPLRFGPPRPDADEIRPPLDLVSHVRVPVGAVPFLDRAADQCAWPLWGVADKHRFVCGAPTAAGRSYCPFHMTRAFDGAAETEAS